MLENQLDISIIYYIKRLIVNECSEAEFEFHGFLYAEFERKSVTESESFFKLTVVQDGTLRIIKRSHVTYVWF